MQLSNLLAQDRVPKKAATHLTANATTLSDTFYASHRFNFRFGWPNGYAIVSTQKRSGQPTPLEVLEIWNQKDYPNRAHLTESPPAISLTIYSNSQRLPLTQWKGELSQNDDRPLSVAGQPAIAYTSTGLYEYDNVLFASPDGRQVFRLQVGYLNKTDRIRQVFSEVIQTFSFQVINSPDSPSKSQH